MSVPALLLMYASPVVRLRDSPLSANVKKCTDKLQHSDLLERKYSHISWKPQETSDNQHASRAISFAELIAAMTVALTTGSKTHQGFTTAFYVPKHAQFWSRIVTLFCFINKLQLILVSPSKETSTLAKVVRNRLAWVCDSALRFSWCHICLGKVAVISSGRGL